jgi:hypothetical protein
MSKFIGQLGELDPESEKISTYLERVKVYMDANAVSNSM